MELMCHEDTPLESTKMKTKTTKPKKINRYWDGLPIVDATHELRVFANADDAVGAVKKDWAECVFAKACGRLFNSRRVAFFRGIAYVELEEKDGTRCIERFLISKAMSDKIKQFDKDHIPPSGGFLLSPPSPCRTLEKKSEQNSRYKEAARERNARRRKAALMGIKEDSSKAPKRKPDMDLQWRNGSGMVHFTHGKGIVKAK